METLVYAEQTVKLRLSPREQQIMDLLVKGEGNKQIAFALGLCEGTVKEYNHRLFKKLGVQNRTQAVVWALSHRPPA